MDIAQLKNCMDLSGRSKIPDQESWIMLNKYSSMNHDCENHIPYAFNHYCTNPSCDYLDK